MPSTSQSSSGVTILGIDPGTVVMGYAVIHCTGKQMQLMHMGTLNMHWEHDVFERLQRIFNTIDEVIRQYKPSQFAIEAPFFISVYIPAVCAKAWSHGRMRSET